MISGRPRRCRGVRRLRDRGWGRQRGRAELGREIVGGGIERRQRRERCRGRRRARAARGGRSGAAWALRVRPAPAAPPSPTPLRPFGDDGRRRGARLALRADDGIGGGWPVAAPAVAIVPPPVTPIAPAREAF